MPRYRFEDFEFREETGELFRAGMRVRLQPQPVQILGRLLARPGDLVTRQELATALWGTDTHTDFETGLNMAVKKLRVALDDDAEHPRLIETLPRRGYRFIGTLQAEKATSEAEHLEPGPVVPPHVQPKPMLWLGLGIAVLLAAASLVWSWVGWRPGTIDFERRDAVVIAQFSNETGQADLDGVIEAALEAELSASDYLAVASSERIADALKLMRQPVRRRVPLVLAQEVCQRDPGLRAAIGGFVRKLGSGYLLSAEILGPHKQSSKIVVSANAASVEDLLRAVTRLSSAIREKLGEAPSARTSEQVSKVTTRSFEALKLYDEADVIGRPLSWAAAEELLKKAVQLDPEFASAHILLAWAVYNQRPDATEEAMAHAERAVACAGQVSDREENFIRGSAAFIQGDLTAAKRYHEVLFRLHPDHYWAGNNLISLYLYTGDRESVRPVMEKMLENRPNDPRWHYRLARECLCPPQELTQRALQLSAKSVELATQRLDLPLQQSYRARDLHTRGMVAWLEGDVPKANALLDEVKRLDLPPRDPEFDRLALGLMTIGRLHDAQLVISQFAPHQRIRWEGWRTLLSGNTQAANKQARELEKFPPHPMSVIQLVRLRRLKAASRMMALHGDSFVGTVPAAIDAARAELLLANGEVEEASRLATVSALGKGANDLPEYLLAAQTAARAHLAEGNVEAAIRVLKEATSGPRACGWWAPAIFWPFVRFELLELLEKQGRFDEAAAIHRELTNLMQFADPTHPLRLSLQRKASQLSMTSSQQQ
jgi:DNA-binding winged helix-turn-helix (wHTH) protein/tetratricopeptide (TPR) repeat protein